MSLREITTYERQRGRSLILRHQQYARKGARVRESLVMPSDTDYTDAIVYLYDHRTEQERAQMVWNLMGFGGDRELSILRAAGRPTTELIEALQ